MSMEKEKMLSQKLFDASSVSAVDLLAERMKAKDLCFELNHLRPSDKARQKEIVKELFGHLGANFELNAPFWCDYGYNIRIGDDCFFNHNTIILDGAPVTFGHHVFVAPNCGFYTAGHPIDAERRNKWLEYAYPITIGNDVWIGAGVHVMPGVTIGNNVVIGGGSIVVKDIPDNCVAVGNPCRPVGGMPEGDKRRSWER